MYTLFLLNAVQGFILWLQLNKFFLNIVLGEDIFYKVPGDSCKYCTVIMLIGKVCKSAHFVNCRGISTKVFSIILEWRSK